MNNQKSNLENKLKFVVKEFGLNFILFFAITFIVSSIFLIVASPNQDTFWYMISYISTGIFAASFITAMSNLPADIFIRNKSINLSLSFFPFVVILLILIVGDKKDMLPENIIKFSIALGLICLTVNFLRFKRVKKYYNSVLNKLE